MGAKKMKFGTPGSVQHDGAVAFAAGVDRHAGNPYGAGSATVRGKGHAWDRGWHRAWMAAQKAAPVAPERED